jgi:two-component sensor histidine kinase
LLLFGGMGVAALLLGLLLARLISARFLNAFAVLQDHVHSLGSRQATLPVRGPVAEINAMDETLYRVANHLNEIMHRQEVLLGEINHRVKNTLATINAIARLTRTSADNVPEFVERFQQRVFALARAYDLLTRTDWSGADLASLVETTVAPYTRSNRVRADGPKLMLRPKFALALAAALQELTTNAAKYGSLSEANGALKVHWQTEGRTVQLEWIESGGPPVRPPVRRGFGTKLVQELLAKDTGWKVDMRHLKTGLECRITMYNAMDGGSFLLGEAAQ